MRPNSVSPGVHVVAVMQGDVVAVAIPSVLESTQHRAGTARDHGDFGGRAQPATASNRRKLKLAAQKLAEPVPERAV